MPLVVAGNDSEGLRYGAIGTPEKYCLQWKEEEADNSRFTLDKYLLQMCRKERLLEMVHLLEPTHNTRFLALMDQFMSHGASIESS